MGIESDPFNQRSELIGTESESFRLSVFKSAYYLAIHCGALCAFLPRYLSWSAVEVAFLLHILTAGFGISLGVHRLFSHRSFQTYRPVQWILAWLASLALQGGPIWWVALHYKHHSHSDQAEDPHSVTKGFWWAHCGWLLTRRKRMQFSEYSKRVPYMSKDPVLVAIEHLRFVSQALVLIVLYLIGGMSWLLWGGCVRLVLSYHCTWLINSACHTWGYRTHEIPDKARNLWWVALITYGEGWHNNHHATPKSARHGLKWWEIDVIWYVILFLKLCKLAWGIRVAEPDQTHQTLVLDANTKPEISS